MAKAACLSEQCIGRRNIFSPFVKIALIVLKACTGFSDRKFMEYLNGNIRYKISCGIMIIPFFPITNFKIISVIRYEMVSRIGIEFLRKIQTTYWKPYLENIHVCMIDVTCYESHMCFPTDMRIIEECLEWLYRLICLHCLILSMRRLRNKWCMWRSSICPIAKKRRRFRGQKCLSAI